MPRTPDSNRLVRFFRERERSLVAVSLVSLLLLGGVAAISVKVRSIRIALLDHVERIVDYWDDRWTRRLEYGERLVNAKDYPRAVEYLVALDRDFPAQYVKHKRDTERERLLRALGQSYAEMDKKRLALETYRRLAEFDSRNFENHYLFAQACLRFKEPKIAEEQFAAILKIHPTHVPSVRAILRMHFDKGDFAAVVAAYETYLNAFLIQQITVALGQSSIKVNVPVDGQLHDIDARLSHSPTASAELALQVGEFAIEIKQVSVQAPLLVGESGVPAIRVWPAKTSWQVQEMAPISEGSYRALGPSASLRLAIPPQPKGVALVHLRLRLFKPADQDLWSMVETSYRNLLRYDDLKAALARSAIGKANGFDS
jgi:tetratricopeptide (TPR) repeat protein